MLEYRITKYNPVIRSKGGQYTEWTSFSEVGAIFDGSVLTLSAYKEVEAAYIAVATAFLREAEVGSVTIRGLERRRHEDLPYSEGETIKLKDVGAIMTKVLREELWCRLESERGFIHFGWDYYMYVGVSSACPMAQHLATEFGLFVEEMQSPYHPDDE